MHKGRSAESVKSESCQQPEHRANPETPQAQAGELSCKMSLYGD